MFKQKNVATGETENCWWLKLIISNDSSIGKEMRLVTEISSLKHGLLDLGEKARFRIP